MSFGWPTFLNFGKDYAGARDGYVYVYSPDGDNAYRAADRMVLASVPKGPDHRTGSPRVLQESGRGRNSGLDRGHRRMQGGLQSSGGCYRAAVSYNAGLRRYLWCQTLPGGDARFRGGFGIYDAPEPWGPWTAAYFTEPRNGMSGGERRAASRRNG